MCLSGKLVYLTVAKNCAPYVVNYRARAALWSRTPRVLASSATPSVRSRHSPGHWHVGWIGLRLSSDQDAERFRQTANAAFGSFSAGRVHESCRSNPMQMTGQVECKWVGKSVQLPSWISVASTTGLIRRQRQHPPRSRSFLLPSRILDFRWSMGGWPLARKR